MGVAECGEVRRYAHVAALGRATFGLFPRSKNKGPASLQALDCLVAEAYNG
jgi:hypothetical protein